MKWLFIFFSIFSVLGSYAAQISSDSFTVRLEYINPADAELYNLTMEAYCAAHSPLGHTICWSDTEPVFPDVRNSDNYLFPKTTFKSQTNAGIKLFGSFRLYTGVFLTRQGSSPLKFISPGHTARFEERLPLFLTSTTKRSNVTNDIQNYFKETIYITTIPQFSFTTSATFVVNKNDTTVKTSSDSDIPRINIDVHIDAYPLDENGRRIPFVGGQFDIKPYSVELSRKNMNNQIETSALTKTLATRAKPSSIELVIRYNLYRLGKRYNITKSIVEDNLHYIDFSEKLSNQFLEISDEMK